MKRADMILGRIFADAVSAYRRFLSPFLPPACRFHPTCSEYALSALACHGAARGTVLSFRRLLRCHPFGAGGFDPVPDPIPGQGR